MATTPLLRPLSAVLLLAALVSTACAQLRDLNSTRDGRGNLRFTARAMNANVSRVQVSLRNNGAAEIRLMSGADQTVYGHWTNSGDRSCHIAINRIGNETAFGEGTVEYDGRGQFTNVTLSATVGRSRFDFSFTADDGRGDRWPGNGLRELNDTRSGHGTYRSIRRNGNADVRRVQVNLRRNGDAEIRILDGINETVRGRWENSGNRTCRLTIQQVGRDRASGTGTVDLNGRGQFDRVRFSARIEVTRVELDFTADDRRDEAAGGGWGEHPNWTQEERDLLNNAHRVLEGKFPGGTRFEYRSESVGRLVLGERVLRGEFRTSGRDQGQYRYTATLTGGRGTVKSLSYSRF